MSPPLSGMRASTSNVHVSVQLPGWGQTPPTFGRSLLTVLHQKCAGAGDRLLPCVSAAVEDISGVDDAATQNAPLVHFKPGTT